MRRKAAIGLVMLALAAATLAGCTPRQSTEQYEERLEQAIAVRTVAISQLDDGSLTTPAQFDELANKVVASIDELDADAPPRKLQTAHERMLDGLDGLAALISRLGRCVGLSEHSQQDARACRQSIGQEVYDEIRNDFGEADTIYREEGLSLPGLAGDGDKADGGDQLGKGAEGGDEL